jgi:hypothetical protein
VNRREAPRTKLGDRPDRAIFRKTISDAACAEGEIFAGDLQTCMQPDRGRESSHRDRMSDSNNPTPRDRGNIMST